MILINYLILIKILMNYLLTSLSFLSKFLGLPFLKLIFNTVKGKNTLGRIYPIIIP